MRFSQTAAAAVLAALPVTLAQTFTDCNPLEKTCPKNDGLKSSSFESDFVNNKDAEKDWSTAAWTTMSYGDQGAQFRIAKSGQAPTIETNFYFFFGHVDVTMKPAPGQGIISSIVLESDDLDEIDWEFLGGVDNKVQTNFFGKGNTTSYDRMIEYNVDSAQETWHTYSLDWTSERLQWIIDGTVVRELKYTDDVALNGKTYPQTPMRLKLGNWAGGAEGQPEGTIQWAGGLVDFSQAPFDMYVKEVKIENYNPADSYEWGDKTGSWESIKINKDGSSSSSSGGSKSKSDSSATSESDSSSTQKASSTISDETYTSSANVEGLDKHTEAANSVTKTGDHYSINTASATALNSDMSVSSTLSTAVSGSTQAAGYSNSTQNGNSTYNNSSATGPIAAEQTTNAGAALKSGMTALSAVGIALSVFML